MDAWVPPGELSRKVIIAASPYGSLHMTDVWLVITGPRPYFRRPRTAEARHSLASCTVMSSFGTAFAKARAWNSGDTNIPFVVQRLRRLPHMKIDKVLAVYGVSPLLLVVESAEGELLELSLREMKTAGHSLSDAAWKSCREDYEIFDCQRAPR